MQVDLLEGGVESRNRQQTAEHLLFDCEALAKDRFTVFYLVTKDGGILQENMAGSIPRYCRLIDLLAVPK